jgi:hypothetical protein
LTLEDKVRLYCEAIHTQDTDLFRTLWSEQSPCTLLVYNISSKHIQQNFATSFEDADSQGLLCRLSVKLACNRPCFPV